MRKTLVVFAVIVVAGVLALAVRRCARREAPAAPHRVAVSVMPAVASNIELCVEATGNAEAHQEVNVSAQIAEKLMVVLVDEGTVVTAGQVLAELDVREAQASLDAASRTVDSVESSLGEAGASLTNAVRTFERVKNLKTERVVGQQQYDESETAMKVAQSRTALATALLNQARAKERELAVRVDRCTIRAPFAGIIAARYLDPGSYLAPGTPLLRLTQINPLSVKVQMPEGQATDVEKGCPARVLVHANHGVMLTGTVLRVYPVVDERWRTQTVELECPNDAGEARPGMFAKASIITGRSEAMLVPDVAVMRLPGSGITHLYTVQTGIAVRVDVTVTRKLGGFVAIRGPLAPGQDVVVKGQQRLQTGMAVEPVRTEMLP